MPAVDRILLIDGDEDTARLVGNAIRGARELTLERSETLSGGLERLRAGDARLVLVAADLPDGGGARMVRALRKAQPDVPILVLGDISEPEAVRIAAAGAQACLQKKALTQTTLQRALSRALANKERTRAAAVAAKPAPRLARSLTIGTLAVAGDGTVRSCNPAMAKMLGRRVTNELVGQSITKLLVRPADWGKLRRGEAAVEAVALAMRHAAGGELRFEGEVLRQREQDPTAGIELLLVDFTTQHQLERALQSAAHAEALAALTAGLAHDFNNLLTVIVGNLYLLAESVREDDALLGKVKMARDAARRGADLTKQLLTFARQKNAEPQVVGVGTVMADIALLLERALGSKIALTTEVAPDVWPVSVDATQLESAVINLAVNARDALEDGGTVGITVQNTRIEAEEARRLELAPGDYVSVAVADDGPGIPEEIRAKIFEAFFTTKAHRGGTGLGLGMVRRMVAAAHGAVDLETEVGRGTTFRLLLPRARGEAQNKDATQPLSTLPAGSESVLVSCTDAEVAQTVHELLDVLGYRVTSGTDLEAAATNLIDSEAELLVCEAPQSERTLLLELIEAASKRAPTLKILLVTDDPSVWEPERDGVHGVLRKPFSLADLARAVRDALDR